MPFTTVTLYRLGNTSGPRMDHVRDKDIELFELRGETWVRAGTGGISTTETPGPLKGIWWRLDAGHAYNHVLLVWNDHDAHWSWEPSHDMRLADFQAELRTTNPHFFRV